MRSAEAIGGRSRRDATDAFTRGGSAMFSLRTRLLRACRRSLIRRAVTLAAIALTIAPALAVAEVPFAATPDADPFYAQPKPFPNLPVGTVLQSRPILFRPSLRIPMLNQAWRIQYVSR